MCDLGKIAEKLGKRPATFAMPGERDEECVDIEQIVFRYPAVSTLCLIAICSIVVIFAASIVVALLIAATIT